MLHFILAGKDSGKYGIALTSLSIPLAGRILFEVSQPVYPCLQMWQQALDKWFTLSLSGVLLKQSLCNLR
jgi:hypothetical protein